MYDCLIVGAGLFGAVFAFEAHKRGRSCLVIEKRPHIGGNCYTEEIDGIQVHMYGPHIFHTGSKKIWEYMNSFSPFINFINAPVANFRGQIYNLPFNMNTFNKMWGVVTPAEAKQKIAEQRDAEIDRPQNLEEQALATVGRDIYEKLIKGYTEKQWGRPCVELPADIIRRLPVRFSYDNNYYNDQYQGVPEAGYTPIIAKMLEGAELQLGVDFNAERQSWRSLASRVLYTGPIDAYFDHCYGKLAYRSLRFEHESLDTDNYQGVAVMNYTDRETPYTRVIEHKHYSGCKQRGTVISLEYPLAFETGEEPYYPIEDEKNLGLYQRYAQLAAREDGVLFGGRLGEYRYYDMDDVVDAALCLAEREFDRL